MSENSRLQLIRGHPFPSAPWFPKKYIEETLDYVPQDSDIVIASYPKTGTTWLQYIVLQIVSAGELYPTMDEVTYKLVPFLEMTGTAVIDAIEYRPRIYKHHCPYNMVQKNSRAKYIYIYRHPEDTVVSFYHFLNELREAESPTNFNQHFEYFMSGNIGYGSYFEHVKSFLSCQADDNLLLVSYEKLLSNRKEGTLEIAKFLGEDLYQKLCENESLLEKILECTSFNYMKQNLSIVHPLPQSGEKKINFFRKGIAGDGKNLLTAEQTSRLKEVALNVLNGTEIVNEWYNV